MPSVEFASSGTSSTSVSEGTRYDIFLGMDSIPRYPKSPVFKFNCRFRRYSVTCIFLDSVERKVGLVLVKTMLIQLLTQCSRQLLWYKFIMHYAESRYESA